MHSNVYTIKHIFQNFRQIKAHILFKLNSGLRVIILFIVLSHGNFPVSLWCIFNLMLLYRDETVKYRKLDDMFIGKIGMKAY